MSDLLNPLIKDQPQSKGDGVRIDFMSYASDSAKPASVDLDDEPSKKRGRPPKTKTLPDGSVMVPANQEADLPMMQTNTPYLQSYGETNMLLRSSIGEIDSLNGVVRTQLDSIVESKTLRKKYDYVSELSSTAASLIGTKIRTISEMNKVITDAHNLDIKRLKDLKMSAAQEEGNDDKRMMDYYSAFINTPVGSYGITPPAFPSMQDMTMPGSVMGVDIGAQNASLDPGYNDWRQSMTPETSMMIMQKNNPNIKTVVVYDQTTNNKYFDVRDMTTGQSIPGAAKPDDFLLGDTYPNINNGTARNSNIDTVYPLILTGAPSSLQDY